MKQTAVFLMFLLMGWSGFAQSISISGITGGNAIRFWNIYR